MGKIHDGVENAGEMGSQPKAGYPILWWGVGFLSGPAAWAAGLAGHRGGQMRRTFVSAAIGVVMAGAVFYTVEIFDNLRRASDIAALQAEAAELWLGLSEVEITDGTATVEPVAKWTVETKRALELRIAVNTRDIATGEPVCLGGTVTFILDKAPPATYSRPLSRIAGVDRCDWPAGVYRSRFTWTMTDPVSRVSKTLFQESDDFSVLP